ncbi:MAG TPA: helicase-associated domain-containing protein [Chloroflexia bacterium]|nr:helicase-associated domain-containing protein [Chloroflexia bacterium]
MLSLYVVGRNLPLDKPLNEGQLMEVLDSYNAPTLMKMVYGRGLSAVNKKEANLRTLSKNFYDETSIRTALQRLSKEGQIALMRLARLGEEGVLPYHNLRQQLISRYNADFANNAFNQIIGSALALYAFRHNNQLTFETPYNKHSLEGPGSLGMPYQPLPANTEIVIWVPFQILKLLSIDPALAAELTPPKIKSFDGKSPVQVKSAARFEALLADIFTFTRYVEQNKPKVLQSGDLGKRDFNKLAPQLSVKDNTAQARRLDELPYLNFLWRLLLQSKLLEIQQGSGQVVVGQPLVKFYGLPRWEQARELTDAWVKSPVEEFTGISTLRFYTTDPLQSSVPTLERQQQARQYLLQLWQQLYREKRFAREGLEGDWLDFETLIAVVKEAAFEILISHSYVPDKSGYSSYYAYMGDFGRGYYKGFISLLKPPDKIQKVQHYYRNEDRSRALSLDTDWNWVEGEWLAHLLGESLSWLGLTELGLDEKTKRPVAFRFTTVGLEWLSGQPSQETEATRQQLAQLAEQAPELARPLIVQPNFEILVLDPLQNLTLLRQLEQFATQGSMSEVALYRMSKESVLKGFRQGWDAPSILKLLADNSRVPVAQNIETSLTDWSAAFQRLILRPGATLLEVGNPIRLEQVIAERPDLGLRRLGDHFALVAVDKAQEAAKALNPKSQPASINTAQIVRETLSFKDAYTLEARNTTPYQLYRLGQFADLAMWEKGQRLAVFKLTDQSVERARRLGLNYQQITETYRQWLGTEQEQPRKRGMPKAPETQNAKLYPETELALKGWLGEYGKSSQIESAPAMLLQVTNPQILDDLFKVGRFANFLLSRPAPQLALVKQENFEQLRLELAKLNLSFKEGVTYQKAPPAPVLIPAITQGQPASIASMLNMLMSGELLKEGYNYQDNEAEDGFFNYDLIEPDFVIHLLGNIVDLLQEMKPNGPDYLNFMSSPRFAQRLLDMIEQEGFRQKKRDGIDQYWTAKHEEAHFFADLTTGERREILIESALEAMTSDTKSERQAAVRVLSLLGPRVARELTELLYHPDPVVRYNTCQVLAEVGDEEALMHLQAVVQDPATTPEGTVGQAAQHAAAAIRIRLK